MSVSSLGSLTKSKSDLQTSQDERSLSDSSVSTKTSTSKTESEATVVEVNPYTDILTFTYSFGYDCQQPFNLCVVEENILVYYSGTLIHIFDHKNKTFSFRKSYSKSGIGHIVKNPTEPHLALGEKCANPLIIIYEWPSFDIISKMSGGTTLGYSHLGYSPDGTMLVSQGSEPDHLITIWDWKNSQIILRVKSHGQDVQNVEFSQFVPGQLTSCGLGHIKFWKMVKTFTGLKLQGELGRFGKTELCDIRGICAMPDEKVISGSEWGNLLVWEDRLIKLEVKQKAKGNCHNADISQIHYNPITEDIISVGMDGWIKLWNRVTIDSADPPDEEDWYLEMQPILEIHVKDDTGEAKLMSLCKKTSDPDDYDWFGQDANGGIWSMSLNAEGSLPKRLFFCHAGSVAAMATSPVGHYLATLAKDGCMLVYDTVRNMLLSHKRFKAPGTALIWLPTHVETTGAVLVGGFTDGMLRMIVISLREIERAIVQRGSSVSAESDSSTGIHIIQKIKSHTAPVTYVGLNPRGSILVSGSEDSTIFVYQILPKREYITLIPIGYVQLTGPVTYITWRPKRNSQALVACADGSLTEVELPEKSLTESSVSFVLNLDTEVLHFKSIKSELIRAEEIREVEEKKEAKVIKKRAELEKIKESNPNLDIDEDLYLIDSDEEVEFPPLYYPETSSPILFVMLLPSNNVILSMGGYDSGFLYEYAMGFPNPVNNLPVPNALSTPLQCFIPLCNDRIVAFGMANGVIRLVPCNEGTLDFKRYYDLPMHDTDHGVIHHLCISHDGKCLFSCGSDGNIFMYTVDSSPLDQEYNEEIKDELGLQKISVKRSIISGPVPREVVGDVDGSIEPSLEETKRNAQNLHLKKLANEHKENIRRKLLNLQIKFDYILAKNNSLPTSQMLPRSVFELDPRITSALEEKIMNDNDLMRRQMAFKVALSRLLVKKMQNHFIDKIGSLDVTVRAIKNEDLRVKAFTHNKLSQAFLDAECDMQQIFDLPNIISSHTFDFSSQKTGSIVTTMRQSVMSSLYKIQTYYNKLTLKGRKALLKQQMLKSKRDQRVQQWQIFLELKPNIKLDDPVDISKYEIASKTIGDFNLKSADTYKVPQDERITPAQKYWQMIKLHREVYETKEAFNKKVCSVRDAKIALVRRFKQLYHDLDIIQEELIPDLRIERPPVPKCYLKNNFPEHIFRLEFGADPLLYQPVSDPYDEEYHVLQIENSEPVSLEYCEQLEEESEIPSYFRDENSDSPWEHQLKLTRMVKTLHRQNTIIKEMEEGLVRFDDMLERLSIDRLKFARDIKLMEIFYLTLYQELVIINSYAGREHEITLKINSAVQIRNEKFRQKMLVQDYIDSKQQDINLLQSKLSELQEHVTERTANTKFMKFLNRIFKKKRTSKTTDDSESESSSSEESSEEEFEDDDNEDFIPIKLDENVCPEGCDPNLYEDVISSRLQRYDMEDTILEFRKQLEKYQKDLQICNAESNRLDLDVQKATKELEAVQFEKQQKLNNVESIVVLNLSQFRHFVSTSHPEDGLVTDPLVFHSEVLFKLSNRVGELEKETEEENVKIKQQQQLMRRLNKRCRDMRDIKKSLKKQIDEELIAKFGEKIDIDRMEETILKKMLNQARRDYEVDLLMKKYDKITIDAKNELWRLTDTLILNEKENSRRLKIQTMLEHETWNLRELMRSHDIKKEKALTAEELKRHEKDIIGLEEVLKEQMKVKEELQHEIRILSYKCTPPEHKKGQSHATAFKVDDIGFASNVREREVSHGDDKLNKLQTEDKEETEIEDQLNENLLSTIDNILQRLASGSSAYEVAVAVVDDLLNFTDDKTKKSSAMECALQLIDQLIQITSGQDIDDITLVEKYAGSLVKLAEEDSVSDTKSKES